MAIATAAVQTPSGNQNIDEGKVNEWKEIGEINDQSHFQSDKNAKRWSQHFALAFSIETVEEVAVVFVCNLLFLLLALAEVVAFK